jgi:hypothetical protein
VSPWFAPPVYLRVAPEVMWLVLQRAFSSNTVWEVPREALTEVVIAKHGVRLEWRGPDGPQGITLRRLSRPVSVPPPLKLKTAELGTWLGAWHGDGAT